jgi:hypothetical protein
MLAAGGAVAGAEPGGSGDQEITVADLPADGFVRGVSSTRVGETDIAVGLDCGSAQAAESGETCGSPVLWSKAARDNDWMRHVLPDTVTTGALWPDDTVTGDGAVRVFGSHAGSAVLALTNGIRTRFVAFDPGRAVFSVLGDGPSASVGDRVVPFCVAETGEIYQVVTHTVPNRTVGPVAEEVSVARLGTDGTWRNGPRLKVGDIAGYAFVGGGDVDCHSGGDPTVTVPIIGVGTVSASVRTDTLSLSPISIPAEHTRSGPRQPTATSAQMIHHNIAGNTLHGGAVTALSALRAATNLYGAPLAFSMNEVCLSQALEMIVWLKREHGLDYTGAMWVQNPQVDSCADHGSSLFGAVLLTVGVNHRDSANCNPTGLGFETCGFGYRHQLPDQEVRGALCMTAGVTSVRGYACTTHILNFNHPVLGSVRLQQVGEYLDIVKLVSVATGLPVNFAGDLYTEWPEITARCAARDLRCVNADTQARETWKAGDGTPKQVDHVMALAPTTRLRNAEVFPLPGSIYPIPGVFNFDHKIVTGFLDFDG